MDTIHQDMRIWFDELSCAACQGGRTLDNENNDEQLGADSHATSEKEETLDEWLQLNMMKEEPGQKGLCGRLNLCGGICADLKRRLACNTYFDDWKVGQYSNTILAVSVAQNLIYLLTAKAIAILTLTLALTIRESTPTHRQANEWYLTP